MTDEIVDFNRCQMNEKEVIEGLCLSFDLLRGLCMETGALCEAQQETNGKSDDLEP